MRDSWATMLLCLFLSVRDTKWVFVWRPEGTVNKMTSAGGPPLV